MLANAAPAVTLANEVTDLAENVDTAAGVKVADIVVTDDDQGTNLISLEGLDAELFEMRDLELWLVDGAVLDHETNPVLDVRVEVDDPEVGSEPDDTATLSITIDDVNEQPTILTLSGSAVAENVPGGTSVGTFSAADPEGDSSFAYLLVSGAGSDDNSVFSLDAVSGELTTAGNLDFEAANRLTIRIRVTDAGNLFQEESFTIDVIDVNEAPVVALLDPTLTLTENADVSQRIQVATLEIQDDALGTNALVLSGADARLFEIEEGKLFLSADATLDHETNATLTVDVKIDDASIGDTPDSTASLAIGIEDVNEVPIDILLSDSTVDENQNSGGLVGFFATVDPDAGEDFTYSFVEGSNDNAMFGLDPATGELTTAVSFNFEAQSSYTVRVQATDSGGLTIEKVFLISINDINEAPTELLLSNSSVAENQPSGALVGTLSTVDPEGSGSFAYELVPGDGSSGNSLFTIEGDQLKTAASLDVETQSSYSIRVRTTDSGGLSTEAVLTISVVNQNDAPVIGGGAAPALLSIAEDNRTSFGTPVWMLLEGVSDADSGAQRGIAVTSLAATNGNWQYTLDGGVNWLDLGTVTAAEARLLPANGNNSRIRFRPNQNFNGTAQLTYYAWDQTQGTAGGTLDLSAPSSRGGTTAISAQDRTSMVTVTPVNDAPVANAATTPAMTSLAEDNRNSYGTPVWMLLSGVSDVDTGALRGAAITALPATNGNWQYTLNGGVSWLDFGAASASTARLLPADGNNSRLRFQPNQDFNGALQISYCAWDRTQGSVGGTFDVSAASSRGGSTAFSVNIRASSLTVTPVNDAPLMNSTAPALYTIQKDNRNSYGTPVWVLLTGATDVDAAAQRGVAITDLAATNGNWQYTLDAGTTWVDFGSTTAAAARLLPANGNNSRIRFQPALGFTGTATISYYAWDQTQGSVGGTFDIAAPSNRAGSTAFSAVQRTSTISVNA